MIVLLYLLEQRNDRTDQKDGLRYSRNFCCVSDSLLSHDLVKPMFANFMFFGQSWRMYYRPDSWGLNPSPSPAGYAWAQFDPDGPFRLLPFAPNQD